MELLIGVIVLGIIGGGLLWWQTKNRRYLIIYTVILFLIILLPWILLFLAFASDAEFKD